MTTNTNITRITAQVAVEAIANALEGYDEATRLAVLQAATEAGVSDFYLDMIRDRIR